MRARRTNIVQKVAQAAYQGSSDSIFARIVRPHCVEGVREQLFRSAHLASRSGSMEPDQLIHVMSLNIGGRNSNR